MREASSIEDPIPVSYTHLDVYKRQGENCAANGDNPLLLLCRLIGRPYRCDGRWPYQPGAVLAGGRRYADFRRQISVG